MDDFPLCAQFLLPLKTANFSFIVVSPSLTKREAEEVGVLFGLGGPLVEAYPRFLFLVDFLVANSCREGPVAFPSRDRIASLYLGGSPNQGVSHFSSGKVQIVSQTLSGLFLVGTVNRPTKRKRTNRENP